MGRGRCSGWGRLYLPPSAHISTALRALSARSGFAFACQQVSFSRSGLALPRTTNRYQRQADRTLAARQRDD